MIKMIAACTSNGVIGVDGKIPFNYPTDMKQFKKLTTGGVVIMGRKTWESIGRPLPNRENIVITSRYGSSNQIRIGGFKAFQSIKDFIVNESLILRNKQTDIWLIGGAAIYQEGMKYAQEIHLTITPDEENNPKSVKFPWIDPTVFKLDSWEHFADEPKLKYCIYKRI